jgi:hypothetical protein
VLARVIGFAFLKFAGYLSFQFTKITVSVSVSKTIETSSGLVVVEILHRVRFSLLSLILSHCDYSFYFTVC